MICKQCETPIAPPRREYCSRHCSGKWRRNNIYKDKYTNKYRSLSPRNFLMCLCKKKANRRDLDVDELVAIYEKQKGLCALSGREMTYITGQGRVPTNISIDRINPDLGYIPGNIQLTCVQANKMKMELSQEDLLSWCQDILETTTKRK